MSILLLLKGLFILAEVIILFNLLIVVHELGHFLAARWRGLVVERFAIWFGPALWKRTIGGVEFRLGSIPAGGYVALPQMGPMEAIEGGNENKRSELPLITPLDKIIVAAAGPIFSFGLAFILAVAVWGLGRPVSLSDSTTVVGFVFEDGRAAEAGMKAGDKILSVDEHAVTRWAATGDVGDSIIWNIATAGGTIPIVVERDGKPVDLMVTPVAPVRSGLGRTHLKEIGIMPAQTPKIARVVSGSPAAVAGLKAQDLILAVNGVPLLSMIELGDLLKASGVAPIEMTIQSGNVTSTITVTPQIPVGSDSPKIGIEWDMRGPLMLFHQSPLDQIRGSVLTIVKTVEAITSSGSGVNVSHLSGPVGIMRVYYVLFENPDGWRMVLWFSVLLNVNLAMMNMLPLPVLDGGHITMSLIEAVRRKPVNARIQEALGTACALLLIGFMLFVTYYDVLDLPRPFDETAPAPEMQFEKK